MRCVGLAGFGSSVLFVNEIHRLGKAGSEWLLTLMQHGVLALRTGATSLR